MKAIVLAGGSGTRLWPLSREDFPKQFLKIDGNKSLLRETIERLLLFLSPDDIVILTNEKYKFHVFDDLEGLPEGVLDHVVLEPASRNTAPAIALGVKYCEEKLGCSDEEVVLVCPSDHIIRPGKKYGSYVLKAAEVASNDYIVTFGIKPTRPETGYGYIKMKDKEVTAGRGRRKGKCFEVDRFAEKPDLLTAKKYVSSGYYLWNAGIFVFSIGTMKRELQAHIPEISDRTGGSLDSVVHDFSRMPDISIDYAVLERSKRVATIPLELYWNDVGSWDSLYEVLKQDKKGNVRIGDVFAVDTKDSMIIGSERIVSTIGLENILVVETPDAILITKRGVAQKVRDVVKDLKKRGKKHPVESTTVYRPWGSYTILEEGQGYKIKRIVVKPGAKLSSQMHHHRSEHWVVLMGTARVTRGDKVMNVHPNESTYIPMSTKHRLENPGKVPLQIIEVQNGEYLSEDDIVRFDDVYKRK